ncbi:MAG: PAS domain S-box protein, partial [Usitatibacteraceae bacterium]
MSLPVSGPRILLVATPGDVASDAAQQLAQHGYASVSRAAGIVDVPAMLLLAKADVALLHVEQADAAEFTLTLDAFRAQCALPLVLLVGAASGKPSAQVELPASVSSLEKVCLPFDARTLHSAIALAIHKHAAAATLEEMEQRLMLARAGSSAGAWEWDLVKNESYYSPRWFEMFGYAPNEFAVTQDQWRSMIHPDDLAGATAVLKGVFRGNAPGFDREVRMRHRAGHYVPILSRGVVIRDAAGRVMRIAGTTSDLSVRKKIEHDLELQRQFATRIIDTVEQGLTVTDAEGRFEFVNPAYARMCGVEPAELIGKLPEEVSAPGTHDAYANARAERRNGKTTTYESRLQRPDGHVVDVLVTGAPRSLDGQFAGAIAAVTDLTERKRIEAALQATMNELRLITNAVPGLISRIDRNLRFVFANEGYIKRFERPLAEIVGRTIREVVGEDSFRQAEPNITRGLAGQAVSWENTYQSSSGGTRFALVKFVPDFDAEKNVIGFFAIGLDVTDRKLAEAKLRESDEHFRVLIERTPEAIVVHRDKRFLYLNPAALALLGASSAQELIGKSIMDIIHPDFHQLLDERLRKGEQNLPVAPVAEFKLIRLDGGVRYAEVQGTMITYDGVPAAHAVMRDITPRKEAEAMRASLETQLRESQKMEAIGTLAGGIAHDFNNILATILGNTELARQDVLANPKAQESLDEIRKAGTRARDLVQQILSFSRRQPTERKLLALAPIIDEAVRLLRATLLARITLDVRYESGVPMVFADATQLQQVVINLATNAMHAMQGGPGRIDVRLDSV